MNPVLLSSLSLAVLIGVIALGFLKKWNVGILSFGAAMLMGMAAGMTQKQIVAGFNTSLFVVLLGSMFLFSIAQLNGTMDLLAKKTVALAGGRGWAVPIFMYLLGAVVAALGPGTIPGFGIAAMFGVPLALEMKADPFLFCTIGQMGAIAGGIVPWAPSPPASAPLRCWASWPPARSGSRCPRPSGCASTAPSRRASWSRTWSSGPSAPWATTAPPTRPWSSAAPPSTP